MYHPAVSLKKRLYKFLNETDWATDLGVLIDHNLKFHSQCSAVVNKANRLLGLIKRTFLDLSEGSFLSSYKTLVLPILEYGNYEYGSTP